MRPERWQQISQVYNAALERQESKRTEFLKQACGDDVALRLEVERLLTQEGAEAFIESPALEEAARQMASGRMAAGSKISHYRIKSLLGSGGMGDVYLASDTKLGRDVAIKILPEVFSQDRERLARFQREARLLASLNHPNIGAIHELAEADGQPFLVLEFVEGENLQDRLKRGALAAEEGLKVCRQVAEGLEAAHEKGVIHRDLKPANVMITSEDTVKVLDFGLARTFEGELSESEEAHSPTITQGQTQEGVILGTASYMSPEQARGRTLDKRTDIWSFGCLLYEVLTGRRVYEGQTVSDSIAQILAGDPDWDALPAKLNPRIGELLRRCLQKDAKQRCRDIGDARIEIEQVLADPTTTSGSLHIAESALTAASWQRVLSWALGALVLGVAIGIFIWDRFETAGTRPASETRTFHSEIELPEGERLAHFYRQGLALSPDGTQLAFVSGTPPGGVEGRIYLRRLDQWTQQPIPGTEAGLNPFFSPDGKWLGFGVGSRLLKVNLSLAGGDPEEICNCTAYYGIAWGPDDRIFFGGGNGRIFRVSASGGEPEEITQLDEKAREVSHRLPHILPNNSAVFYTVLRYAPFFDSEERAQIFVQSLETGARKLIIEGGSDARYVPTGHVVFARKGRLLAVPFDLERLEVTGPEVPVLDAINHSIHTGNSIRDTGVAQLSFSSSGTLAYVAGSVFPEIKREAVWVDRQGREERLEVEPRCYLSGRVSPDGRHVLLSGQYPPKDVWIFDLKRKLLRRQTFEGNQRWAVWGPGPDHFTFQSDREGPSALYAKKVDSEPGEVEKLPTIAESLASSWSPDNQRLALAMLNKNTDWDLSILSREGKVAPFLHTRFSETHPEFSPDGRWIVYVSNQSGRTEVYVGPSAGSGSAVQFSIQGGTSPAWSRDGREVFYRQDRKFIAVKIDVNGNRLTAGPPTELFEDVESGYANSGPVRSYDVAPDGRFLVIKRGDDVETAALEQHFPPRIRIIQNWFEELKRLAPASE